MSQILQILKTDKNQLWQQLNNKILIVTFLNTGFGNDAVFKQRLISAKKLLSYSYYS